MRPTIILDLLSRIFCVNSSVKILSPRHEVRLTHLFLTSRSSHQEVFCKKGVLRNFTTCTRKHLCQGLFLNRPVTLLKKRLWQGCFPVNFVKFLGTPFLTEHLWWLLLHIITSHVHYLQKERNRFRS